MLPIPAHTILAPAVPAFGFGSQELLIIAGIIFVLFGSAKIPQLMKGLGEGIREFRRSSAELAAPASPSEATEKSA